MKKKTIIALITVAVTCAFGGLTEIGRAHV